LAEFKLNQNINFVIEYTYYTNKFDSEHIFEYKDISTLIFALRLTKLGYFYNIGSVTKIGLDIFDNELGGGFPISIHFNINPMAQYFLEKKNIKIVQNLFEKINSIYKYNQIINSLKWFDSYCLEDNNERRVIFLAIVCECIFTNENEKDVIQHKLASRLASFLETKYENRLKIFEDIKKFYNIRSKILHGENANLNLDLNIYDNYLRKSIVKIINEIYEHQNKNHNLNFSFKTFLSKLDLG
jgi:hypothetical protein